MNLETHISRRKLLKAGLGAGALVALGKYDILAQSPTLAPSSPETTPLVDTEPGQNTLKLGPVETNLSILESAHMGWTPDGRLPFFTTAAGKKRYFFSGGPHNATYLIETDGSKPIRDFIKDKQVVKESFLEVLSPDANSDYRREYVGITSVLQLDQANPDHIFAVTHNEKRVTRDASGTYTAIIGLVESFDAGITWTDHGPIITGTDAVEPGMAADGGPSGAGQPCAIYDKTDGYVKIAFIDWAAGVNAKHRDQLYFARAKVTEGSLEPVEYLTQDDTYALAVEEKLEDGSTFTHAPLDLKPIIPVFTDNPNDYTALPDISWNTKLQKWIGVGESTYGFWVATSDNFTDWSTPEIFYNFTTRGGKSHDILKPGERWDSYPTLLDETQNSADITGENAIFYHTTGDNTHPHQPAALDASIL